MNLKPTVVSSTEENLDFLIDAKNLEWTTGNITLDTSKLDEGQEVKRGTAVFKNEHTNLFELVQSNTPATMKAAVLTAKDVVVTKDVNEHVAALRKASVYEDMLHGVTDNFKEAVQGRIVFDV